LFFGIASPSIESGNVTIVRMLKQGMFKLGNGCLVYQWVTYLEFGFITLNLEDLEDHISHICLEDHIRMRLCYSYLVSIGYIQSSVGCVDYNW